MKSKYTRITGILAVVFSSFGAFLGIGLLVMGATYINNLGDVFETRGEAVACLCIGIVFLAFAVSVIVLGSVLLSRLNSAKKKDGLLIAVVVLSFICGSVITGIFGIIALCNTDAVSPAASLTQNSSLSDDKFLQAVARFKQYKEDGIITEEELKKKIAELVDTHSKNTEDKA